MALRMLLTGFFLGSLGSQLGDEEKMLVVVERTSNS